MDSFRDPFRDPFRPAALGQGPWSSPCTAASSTSRSTWTTPPTRRGRGFFLLMFSSYLLVLLFPSFFGGGGVIVLLFFLIFSLFRRKSEAEVLPGAWLFVEGGPFQVGLRRNQNSDRTSRHVGGSLVLTHALMGKIFKK